MYFCVLILLMYIDEFLSTDLNALQEILEKKCIIILE